MAEATGPQKGPFLRHAKPWVRSVREECQYVICPRCRAGSVDRAFLSLDAVVNGEFLPTAASGYGFHVLGERPVVNAEILKEIGTRAVPFVSPAFNTAENTTYVLTIGSLPDRASTQTVLNQKCRTLNLPLTLITAARKILPKTQTRTVLSWRASPKPTMIEIR